MYRCKKKEKKCRGHGSTQWLATLLFFFHSIEQQQKEKIEPFFHELFHSARNHFKKSEYKLKIHVSFTPLPTTLIS